jgi:hypothetical protein
MHRVITVIAVVLHASNFYSHLKTQSACPVKEVDRVEFSEYTASWKIIFELMTGNDVISEVDAFMCVVLSKAEKHVPYGVLVSTSECVIL